MSPSSLTKKNTGTNPNALTLTNKYRRIYLVEAKIFVQFFLENSKYFRTNYFFHPIESSFKCDKLFKLRDKKASVQYRKTNGSNCLVVLQQNIIDTANTHTHVPFFTMIKFKAKIIPSCFFKNKI